MNSATSNSDFVTWVRGTATLLDGLEPSSNDDEALGALRDIVGSAHVVGLGESWHRTHELMTLKYRIARFLVEHLGFTAAVFTGSLQGSVALDEAVRGGGGSLSGPLQALGQPMNMAGETECFLERLRTWNRGAGPQSPSVHALGLDCVFPGGGIRSVVEYLGRVDRAYAVPGGSDLLTISSAFERETQHPSGASAIVTAVNVYAGMDEQVKSAVRAWFAETLARLQLMRNVYISRSSLPEYLWMERTTIANLQFVDVLRSRESSTHDSSEVRDLAWADNVLWARDRLSETGRVVFFAHNVHVAKQDYPDRPSLEPNRSAGGFLSEWLGEDYRAIGTCVGVDPTGDPSPALAEPTDDDEASIDATLQAVGLPHYLLDVRDVGAPARAWASSPRPMRASGNLRPLYEVSRAFDALVYVDRIRPASALTPA